MGTKSVSFMRDQGLRAARHLDGEIWEVRVDGDRVIYRILFAEEGSRSQILLALEGSTRRRRRRLPRQSSWRSGDWRTGAGEVIRSAKRGASTRCTDEA
jgi:hypothetical protein